MRGLFDGLREGMSKEMTPKKFKLTFDGMSTISQKVFEHVPIQESWTSNQISSAMRRVSGTSPDLKTIQGCLNSLTDVGLIKEVERGLFRQVVPRDAQTNIHAGHLEAPVASGEVQRSHRPINAVSNTIPPEAALDFTKKFGTDGNQAPAEQESNQSPAETIGSIANALRNQARAMLAIADDLDTAALAFEQRTEDAEKSLERFNQLKALLAS